MTTTPSHYAPYPTWTYIGTGFWQDGIEYLAPGYPTGAYDKAMYPDGVDVSQFGNDFWHAVHPSPPKISPFGDSSA